MRPMRRGNGFTLIELLVVVAIISLLVTILLPSLKRARELAYQSVCGANLRNIGAGVAVYLSDHDDTYPSFKVSSIGPTLAYANPSGSMRVATFWFVALSPYVTGEEFQVSTVFTAGHPHNFEAQELRPFRKTFVCPMYHYVHPQTKVRFQACEMSYVINESVVAATDTAAAVRSSYVADLSIHPYLGDGNINYYERPAVFGYYVGGPAREGDGTAYWNANAHTLGWFHPRETANFLMGDGHVETRPESHERFGYPQVGDIYGFTYTELHRWVP